MGYCYKKLYRVINLDYVFVSFDFLRKEDAMNYLKHNRHGYHYELQIYRILKTGRIMRLSSVRY